MTMIPAFGPWTEHPADTDEEKRLASAQQSKTCLLYTSSTGPGRH